MALAYVPIEKVQEAVNLLTSPDYLDPRLKDFARYFTVGLGLILKKFVQPFVLPLPIKLVSVTIRSAVIH